MVFLFGGYSLPGRPTLKKPKGVILLCSLLLERQTLPPLAPDFTPCAILWRWPYPYGG